MKIVIAGIGGVGGYLGGLLARHKDNFSDLEVCFLVRGENKDTIQEKGLQIKSTKGDFIVSPDLITDNPAEIGIADYVLICTKTYGLEALLKSLQPCIDEHTVLIPLQNGVVSCEILKAKYPQAQVWNGCIYTVSKLVAPGVIEETGFVTVVILGPTTDGQQGEGFISLMNEAGIDTIWSDQIIAKTWEKFIFISAFATATSYFDVSAEVIQSDESKMVFVTDLLTENAAVAAKKGIVFEDDIIEASLNKINALQSGATSSMHRDFKYNTNNELEALTGYVIRSAEEFELDAPTYRKAYTSLLMRKNG